MQDRVALGKLVEKATPIAGAEDAQLAVSSSEHMQRGVGR